MTNKRRWAAEKRKATASPTPAKQSSILAYRNDAEDFEPLPRRSSTPPTPPTRQSRSPAQRHRTRVNVRNDSANTQVTIHTVYYTVPPAILHSSSSPSLPLSLSSFPRQPLADVTNTVAGRSAQREEHIEDDPEEDEQLPGGRPPYDPCVQAELEAVIDGVMFCAVDVGFDDDEDDDGQKRRTTPTPPHTGPTHPTTRRSRPHLTKTTSPSTSARPTRRRSAPRSTPLKPPPMTSGRSAASRWSSTPHSDSGGGRHRAPSSRRGQEW